MEAYVWTEKLCVGYGKTPVVEDVELRLEKGEILTLIGPNGAGKTTILRSIARQIELLGGRVYLGGDRLDALSGRELSRRMAVVLTERLRGEMMTCKDVVATGRYPYTGRFGLLSPGDRRAVREAMELVRVDRIGGENFSRISDGQRQRVMLARAICQEPEILILDEPTSYLDVKHKLEFLSILQEMRRKKRLTVILSLHELELAAKVSDKILCVRGRYVDRFGSPEEIFVPGYLTGLFGIDAGSFDERSEGMELEPVRGEPEVFVIAGGGTGRNVYRSLQRRGIPFAAGILFSNDLDCPVAKALASRVFVAESFEPVPGEVLETAKRQLGQCGRVILCRDGFGSWETANRELLEYARARNKTIEPAGQAEGGLGQADGEA